MLKFNCSTSLAALLVSATFLSAQTPVWQPPATGYLHDPVTRSIRAIIGIPGSAYAGPAVQNDVDWASITPNGRSGLVLRSGHLSWFPDPSSSTREPVALDFTDQPAECLWSANSLRAVLLAPRANSVSWLSGLDTVPFIENRWDLSPLHATEWKLLAADSKAEGIIITAKVNGESSIWFASPTNAPASAGTVQQPVAAAFSTQTGTAYIADAGARRVYLVRLQQDGAMESLLGEVDGIGQPSGLLAYGGDNQILVTDAATRTVRLYDLTSRTILLNLDLYEDPGPMVPLGPNRFLVNRRQRADQPFRFLDTSGALKIVFVPAGELQ